MRKTFWVLVGVLVGAVAGERAYAQLMQLTDGTFATKTVLYGRSGTEVTSFGGGTQYTEADTDATITGTALLFEGAANALVAAPGTAANGLLVDVSRVTGTVTVGDGAGALNVICDSGCSGSGGTSLADDADFVAGTTVFTPVGGFYQSTVTACTDGDVCTAGITTGRALKVFVSAADGSAQTLASDMTVGTAFGTTGPGGLGRYVDFDGAALPTATNVDTESEAVPLAASIKGVQYVMVVNEDGSLERGTATTPQIVELATSSAQIGNVSALTGSTVAHDGADTGNPHKIGGYASTTPPTAVSAAGDRVNAWYTLNGAAVTVPGGASVHYRTAAGATEDEHEIKATAGTLYSVLITNTNAAARYIRCYDLTAANTTPGTSTVLWGSAIPGNTAGAGFTYSFPAGLTFATALTCAWTTGAADTDVAEVAANEVKATYTYR